jgi:hypothetical protein
MANQDEHEDDRNRAAETVRQFFQSLFGQEAEAVATAILLDDETADSEEAQLQPADDDPAVSRLLKVVQDSLERTSAVGSAVPPSAPVGLSSVNGGASLRRRRKRDRRRHAPYVRGAVNVVEIPKPRRIREDCAYIAPRMHMSSEIASGDYAFDLKPHRGWLDSHGANWVGDNLLFLDTGRRPLVRVARAAANPETRSASRLIVNLAADNGRKVEVRLSPEEREKDLKLEPEDGSFADWKFSIAIEQIG